MDFLMLILLLQLFSVVDGLECYECVDLDHISIDTGNPIYDILIQAQLEQYADPECEQRVGSSVGIGKASCSDVSSSLPATCSSGDVRIQLSLSVTQPEKLSVKAGFNMQYRECINVPKAEIIQYGCQDAKPFSDIIKMLLKNITDSLEFVTIEHFSFHGNLCLCKEDRCNLNLPMFTSPGPPITKRSTTTPQTSDAPKITRFCYLFCVFLYIMVSVIYKPD